MDINIRQIVNEIVTSPEFRSSIERAVNHNTRNAEMGNNSIEEVRRLFPSIASTSSSGFSCDTLASRPSRIKKRKLNDAINKEFLRDVILVKSDQTKTLTGIDKSVAFEKGYAVSAAVFNRNWTETDIYVFIKSLFQDKILDSDKIEILIPMSGRLIKPNICNNSSLNGITIASLFHQKPIYVRKVAVEEQEVVFVESDMNKIDDINVTTVLNDEEFPIKVTRGMNEGAIIDEYEKDLALAIERSIVDIEKPDSIKDILRSIRARISDEDVTYFNIYREEVFQCYLRAVRRKKFAVFNKMAVVFTDIDGNSEGAIDAGGPIREMFRLLMKYIENSRLFEGDENDKNLTLDNDALLIYEYFEAGRMIALSLVHAGLGPNFFSSNLFNCLVSSEVNSIVPQSKDITDIKVRIAIGEANCAENFESFKVYVEESAIFSIAGFSHVSDFSKKEQIITDTITFFAIHRTRPALEQFVDGLKACGILDEIKKYPNYFENILCYKDASLTPQDFLQMFNCELNTVGSNKRMSESKCLSYWNDFVIECSEGETTVPLEDILIFVTGADKIPALGFDVQPSIKFMHADQCPYPKANTCSLELHLPIHHNYEIFKEHLSFGIKNAWTFGYH